MINAPGIVLPRCGVCPFPLALPLEVPFPFPFPFPFWVPFDLEAFAQVREQYG